MTINQQYEVRVGDKIRSYDFPYGEKSCYFEGEVVAIGVDSPNCPCGGHIKAHLKKRVWEDKHKPSKDKNDYFWTPLYQVYNEPQVFVLKRPLSNKIKSAFGKLFK